MSCITHLKLTFFSLYSVVMHCYACHIWYVLSLFRCDALEQKQNLSCNILKDKEDSWRQTEKAGRENWTAAGQTTGLAGSSPSCPCFLLSLTAHIRSYSRVFPPENQHHQICSRFQEATTGGQHETNRDILSGNHLNTALLTCSAPTPLRIDLKRYYKCYYVLFIF